MSDSRVCLAAPLFMAKNLLNASSRHFSFSNPDERERERDRFNDMEYKLLQGGTDLMALG